MAPYWWDFRHKNNEKPRLQVVPPPLQLRYFDCAHLPDRLREIVKPVRELALHMDRKLPPGAEKLAGMRKLLEAQDAFIRAALEDDE